MSPSISAPLAGSIGIWPDTNKRFPALMAGEYAPTALGASGALITCLTSGRLRHLAVAEASSADPNSFGRAVDHGANCLKVGFEPARPDVVCVGHCSSDNRAFMADLTPLCHFVSRLAPARSPPGGFH